MQEFVDIMLQRLPAIRSDADVDVLLGHLAEHLGYRSAYLLDFPNDIALPVRLWDSDAKRAAWWRALTENGAHSISRSLAEIVAKGGVQHIEIGPDDPRYGLAVEYDFASATVVPVTFDTATRGWRAFAAMRQTCRRPACRCRSLPMRC